MNNFNNILTKTESLRTLHIGVPKLVRDFFPRLDGFWHFNKVSILFYSILFYSILFYSITRRYRKFQKVVGGGGMICWTLANYILLRFFKKKLQNFTEKRSVRSLLRPPLNRPMRYLHWNIILFHHLRAVKNPVWQFTRKVWQFDVSSNCQCGREIFFCLFIISRWLLQSGFCMCYLKNILTKW